MEGLGERKGRVVYRVELRSGLGMVNNGHRRDGLEAQFLSKSHDLNSKLKRSRGFHYG